MLHFISLKNFVYKAQFVPYGMAGIQKVKNTFIGQLSVWTQYQIKSKSTKTLKKHSEQ